MHAAEGGQADHGVQAMARRALSEINSVFDHLAAAGLAPALKSRVAVLSLFGMMNWVYKWHNPEVDPGSDELTDHIVRIFLHGVLPTEAAAKESVPDTTLAVP